MFWKSFQSRLGKIPGEQDRQRSFPRMAGHRCHFLSWAWQVHMCRSPHRVQKNISLTIKGSNSKDKDTGSRPLQSCLRRAFYSPDPKALEFTTNTLEAPSRASLQAENSPGTSKRTSDPRDSVQQGLALCLQSKFTYLQVLFFNCTVIWPIGELEVCGCKLNLGRRMRN